MNEKEMFEVVIVGLLTLFVVVAISFSFGAALERQLWKNHAMSPQLSGTAHHCDGEFYYIVPESTFVNDFVRREAVKALIPDDQGQFTKMLDAAQIPYGVRQDWDMDRPAGVTIIVEHGEQGESCWSFDSNGKLIETLISEV